MDKATKGNSIHFSLLILRYFVTAVPILLVKRMTYSCCSQFIP